MKFLSFFLGAILALTACGEVPDKSGGDEGEQAVEWEKVAADFNPEIETVSFITTDIEKLNLDIFSFNKYVKIVYQANLPSDTGSLLMYRVWKDSPSWGSLSSQTIGRSLNLKTFGEYNCSIKIKNNKIDELKGGCYVKLKVILPKGSEIEVYNVGKLISKRFIVITNEAFLERIVREPFISKKFIIIQEYLQSYAGTSKRPELSSYQLEVVIGEFERTEHKLKVLQKLHRIVTDRYNLRRMIDRAFKQADRDEARQIVGELS